jgi:hypothetical protein
MTKSDSIKELCAALAKAQPQIEGASKDKNNPAFKSKYADLSSVSEAIAAPLANHGLSYVQVSHDRENAAAIETLILHSSGEWMSAGIVAVPVTKHDAHGFGSALTYARRYSLSAAFGVVPEDDDGNAAAKNAPNHAALRPGDGAGKITPSSGFLEKQSIDMQNHLRDLAHRVEGLHKRGDVAGALDEWVLAKADLDEEQTAAAWSLIDSKARSAMKNLGESRNEKRAA